MRWQVVHGAEGRQTSTSGREAPLPRRQTGVLRLACGPALMLSQRGELVFIQATQDMQNRPV